MFEGSGALGFLVKGLVKVNQKHLLRSYLTYMRC